MKLADLVKMGAVVSDALTTKTIEWNGQKFDVKTKQPSYADVHFAQKHEQDGTAPFMSALIARCVFFDGEQMTLEQACAIDPALFTKLSKVIFVEDAKKKKKA